MKSILNPVDSDLSWCMAEAGHGLCVAIMAVDGSGRCFSHPKLPAWIRGISLPFSSYTWKSSKNVPWSQMATRQLKPSMELLIGLPLPRGSAYPLEEPFVIASEEEVMETGAAIVDTVELWIEQDPMLNCIWTYGNLWKKPGYTSMIFYDSWCDRVKSDHLEFC